MRVWEIDPLAIDAQAIEEAAARLRDGGLVAFPTETVYGLGANALDDTAVREIFTAKGRPADNPLIVHIADESGLADVIANPDALSAPVRRAMAAFWPGPLTIILPASPALAEAVHPGMHTVGVRCPKHPVAHALIAAAGVPIAAPSANKSGRPSPTTAQDVQDDLAAVLDGIIDGGPCPGGLESTVVQIHDDGAVIYRPGNVTREALEQAIGLPVVDATQPDTDSADDGQGAEVSGTGPRSTDAGTPSPGMKYRHYAPNARVHVWAGDPIRVQVAMMQFIDEHEAASTAVISSRPFSGRLRSWMPESGTDYATELSQNLYHLLRAFDREGVSHILIQGVPRTGLGAAIMNRLDRAAEGRVVSV